MGTSAGGRRPKAIINLNPETGEYYSGQVAAPKPGFIPMIVKFDEHSDIPSTRIEYSYYLMAKDAGLGMMPSQLMESETTAHFLAERFARQDGEKLHVPPLRCSRLPAVTRACPTPPERLASCLPNSSNCSSIQ